MKPGHSDSSKFASRFETIWLGSIIVFATLLAYWPVYSAGFIWDDDTHITDNSSLTSLAGLWDIWFNLGATCQYYPLTFTVFWLDYHLWGLNPLGYHLQNVLLHGTVAVLLWQVLKRLEVRAAWLAGAIFALHPVAVMSVAWATELKNTLAGLLALAAAWSFLRFAGLGIFKTKAREQTDWRYGLLLLALFQLAMFAKTAVCFLPVTLLLLAWWKTENLTWRQVWPLPIMVGISAGMGLLTLHVEHIKGATGNEFDMAWLERVIISGQSFWFYLGKLFFPCPLTFIYERWNIEATRWWKYIYPLATLGLFGTLWLIRKRTGKGALAAVLHFYFATSFLILIQVLYMMRFTFVTDHWQYFGCMSVIALAAGTADRLLKTQPTVYRLRAGLVFPVLLILGAITWQQCKIYQNLETLWTDTLKKNPNCWMAHTNLGRLLAQRGLADAAETHYQAALRINPNDENIHYNYGNLLARTGRLDDAVAQYQAALQLAPDKAETHCNLGFVLNKLHRTDEAIAEYERAIFYQPDLADAYYNLGNALAAQQKTEAAIAAYQRAARLKPDSELFKKRLQALGVPAN